MTQPETVSLSSISAAIQELPPDRIEAYYEEKVKAGGILGSLAVGTVVTSIINNLSDQHMLSSLAIGAGAAGLTHLYERRKRGEAQDMQTDAILLNHHLSRYIGREAEYYRVTKPSIALETGAMYVPDYQAVIRVLDKPIPATDEPPVNDDTVIARLIALGGAVPSITKVVVSKDMADRTKMPFDSVDPEDRVQALHIYGKSGVNAAKRKIDREVASMTAKKLLTWQERSQDISSEEINEYVSLLQLSRPNDPLTKALLPLNPSNRQHRDQMRHILQRRIERDIEEVAVERTGSLVPERQRLYIGGTVHSADKGTIPTVNLRDQYYRPQGSGRNVLQMLDQDLDSLEHIIRNPHAHPKEKFAAVSTLLFLKLSEAHEIKISNYARAESGANFADTVICNKAPFMMRRYIRACIMGMSVLAATAVINTATEPVSAKWNDSVLLNESEEKLEAGKDKILDVISPVFEMLKPNDGSGIIDIEGLRTSQTDPLYDDLTTHVGNVRGNVKNKAQWQLDPRDGMSTVGYWGLYASALIDDQVNEWMSLPEPYDEDVLELPGSRPPLASEVLEPGRPAIVVSREVQPSISTQGLWYQVPVPILEGTEVRGVTATLSDGTIMNAAVTFTRNGGTVLALKHPTLKEQLSHNEKIQLAYVIEPSSISSRGYLKMYDPVRVSTAPGESRDVQDLDATWSQTVNSHDRTGNNTVNDIKYDSTYINSTFPYALSPLPEDDMEFADETDFARTVLTEREAQCNIASTLLALSYPDKLNYAVGYMNKRNTENSPDSESALSIMDAHAWTVDAGGNRYDPTPVKLANEGEREVFAENYTPKTPEAQATANSAADKVLYIGAVGVLGAASLIAGSALFGRAKKRAERIRNNRSMYKLGKLSMEDVNEGFNLLSLLTYGDNTSPQVLTRERSVQNRRDALQKRAQQLPERKALRSALMSAEQTGRLCNVSSSTLQAAKVLTR